MNKYKKIGIGTVQFGVDYGLSNQAGRVELEEVMSILKFAKSLDIDLIDTSPAYGVAESVLGTVLTKPFPSIVTKTVRIEAELITKAEIENIKSSFYSSLKKMKKESVYGLIAHQGYDLCKPGHQLYTDLFNELKARSKVKKIGASVYSKAELDEVLRCCNIDLVQLPLNIFDQELLESGYLELLHNKGIEIHVRSVFLQGLVFMDKEKLDSYFSPIISTLTQFGTLLTENNISALDASLAYVINSKYIDRVILGVQSVGQLEQIADSLNKNIKLPSVEHLSLSHSDFVNPSKWKLKGIL